MRIEAGEKDDSMIARTIMPLAQHLGLDVVAEGVETIEQADLLKATELQVRAGIPVFEAGRGRRRGGDADEDGRVARDRRPTPRAARARPINCRDCSLISIMPPADPLILLVDDTGGHSGYLAPGPV